MSAAHIDVVWWEDDPTKTRPVIRGCLLCYPLQDLDEVMLVSPTGIAHQANDDRTWCGKDATGPEWWWRT